MTNQYIKSLRVKRGFSQSEIALKMGISRTSYIAFEQGKRELTLAEANELSKIFDISLQEIQTGKDITPEVVLGVSKKISKEKNNGEIKERISVPQEQVEKFKQVLLYVLSKVGGKPNIGQTVLYKLLYFIDFDYYEKFEEQFIGATYIKNHFGPTPVEFKKIVDLMEKNGELETVKSKHFQHDQTKYLPRRESDISVLNAREIKHIDDVLSRLSNKSAVELSDYSHKDVPWITAKEGRPLEYESVFYRTKDTSVREYEPDKL